MHDHHIFLSYRSLEKDFALKLARDLKLAGFSVWMDCMEGIRLGDDWRDAIQKAIEGCGAMISVLSPEYVKSEYCKKEVNRANTLERPIFPVLFQRVEPREIPLALEGVQYVDFTNETHYQKGFDALIKRLKEEIPDTPRVYLDAEKRYLIEVIAALEKGRGVQEYIELHGKADAVRPQPLSIDELGYYKLLDSSAHTDQDNDNQTDIYLESIREAQELHARFVLLGVPGSGKTTTLRRMARLGAQLRLENPKTAPLPIWIPLAAWQDEEQDLFGFIQTHWPLDGNLKQLLANGDVVLYMDGLNEMGEGAAGRITQLKNWLHGEGIAAHVFVSCRIEDYHDDLKLPQVIIEPLSDQQIHQFAEKYLEERNAEFLQRLYGDNSDKSLVRLARNPYLLGALIYLYQESDTSDLPRNSGDLSRRLVAALWERERQRRTSGWVPFEQMQMTISRLAFDMIDRGMPTLVSKQYFLKRLAAGRFWGGHKKALSLFNAVKQAHLIETRGELVGFYHQLIQEYFAAAYLLKAGLSGHVTSLEAIGEMGHRPAKKWDQVVIAACGCDAGRADAVLNTVAELDPVLAVACVQSGAKFSEAALQKVRQAVADCIADRTNWRRRKLGVETAALLDDLELLVLGAQDFDHKVRYSALRAMIGRSEAIAVKAFVDSMGFRDAAVQSVAIEALSKADSRAGIDALLEALHDERANVRLSAAGALTRYMDDPHVIKNLKALLNRESHVDVQEKLGKTLKVILIQDAIRGDISFEALFAGYKPVERAEMGRSLSEIGDPRPGVGVIVRDGAKLPDIAWSELIPPGAYPIGGDGGAYGSLPAETCTLEYSYQVSKYPVTYAQFQVFLEAADGYSSKDHDWFKDMAAGDDDKQVYEQRFKYASHPREMVNWYQALAYCRWLSWRLTDRFYQLDEIAAWPVRLPTEKEWEIAARGPEGRFYPYAGEFDAGKGNTRETGIGQTSAVGIFPAGVSWCGALDMSGNVWEWCINPYDEPEGGLKPEHLRSSAVRVLRGGSWHGYPFFARAASRYDGSPFDRNDHIGFRLCRLPHL